MARIGERGVTPARGKDEEFGVTSLTQYIQAVQELWKMESAKQGAQGVALRISNRQRSGAAGRFTSTGPDGFGGPVITIWAPAARAWDKGARGDLVETSRIIRHELAHFQQFRRAQVGRDERPTDASSAQEFHHGQDFRDIQKQFGGGVDLRPAPRNPQGPPAQPRRGNPPRFGLPDSLPTRRGQDA